MAIYDVFSGQMTARVEELLDANNIVSARVPSGCTDYSQPLDLSVNKPAKDHLKLNGIAHKYHSN